MSEEKLDESAENKVVLSSDDVKNVNEYFKHFNIPMPDHLKDGLKKFDGEPTIENQKFLKLQICRVLLESPHESFQDGMFDTVKETASKAKYDLQFEFDVKDELSRDEEAK